MEALTALEVDRTIWWNHLLYVISSISQSHTLIHKTQNKANQPLIVTKFHLYLYIIYLYFNGGKDLYLV